MEQNRKDDSALPGIGAALKKIRESANVSKRQMAEKANIQREQLDRIEHGRSACSTRTMYAYLDACGVDFVALLKGAVNSGEKTEKAKAGRPKGKGFDHSLLPPMTWAWREDLGCWYAMEMMYGYLKEYRAFDDGRAERWDGNQHVKLHGGTDKESAINLVNDWRYYDGHQLPT